ncbi:MAG: hypothetical protein GY820_17790 [Gammaproteobacteria bacterium]|nr:hypothetical protein [Gammaproteobacteria bacterium]
MPIATTCPKLIQIGSAQVELCPSEWCFGKEEFEFRDFGAKNGPARKLGYLYGLRFPESFRLKKIRPDSFKHKKVGRIENVLKRLQFILILELT